MAQRRSSRSTKAGGADVKRLMETIEGRWIWVPILIAIIASTAVGLLAALLPGGDQLPPGAFTAPAGVSVAVYYAFQLRIVWRVHLHARGTKMRDSKGVGGQTVSGSAVAPVITGDENVVNVTLTGPGATRPDAKIRIQFVRASPVKPANLAWYCIEVANPSAETAVVAGLEWIIDHGPGQGPTIIASLGLPLFVEVPDSPRGNVLVGGKVLERSRNVEIPPGHVGAFYVQGSPNWNTYRVRATFHVFGPRIEDLHHTELILTPRGLAWNLSDGKAPAPPDPFRS